MKLIISRAIGAANTELSKLSLLDLISLKPNQFAIKPYKKCCLIASYKIDESIEATITLL